MDWQIKLIIKNLNTCSIMLRELKTFLLLYEKFKESRVTSIANENKRIQIYKRAKKCSETNRNLLFQSGFQFIRVLKILDHRFRFYQILCWIIEEKTWWPHVAPGWDDKNSERGAKKGKMSVHWRKAIEKARLD